MKNYIVIVSAICIAGCFPGYHFYAGNESVLCEQPNSCSDEKLCKVRCCDLTDMIPDDCEQAVAGGTNDHVYLACAQANCR